MLHRDMNVACVLLIVSQRMLRTILYTVHVVPFMFIKEVIIVKYVMNVYWK